MRCNAKQIFFRFGSDHFKTLKTDKASVIGVCFHFLVIFGNCKVIITTYDNGIFVGTTVCLIKNTALSVSVYIIMVWGIGFLTII